MKRSVILIGVGAALLAGLAGAAYAQAAPGGTGQGNTPGNFKYELRGNQRVAKPDSTTRAADGTVREEFKSGHCVTVKETLPDGAIRKTEKCD
jgi:hypothetical protein